MLIFKNFTEKRIKDLVQQVLENYTYKDNTRVYNPVLLQVRKFKKPEYYPERLLREYLKESYLKNDFSYTYPERINSCLEDFLKKRKENFTQAVILVFRKEDFKEKHPPCLSLIYVSRDLDGENLNVIFRSWDLILGMPANILYVLKKFKPLGFRRFNFLSFNAHIYYKRDKDLIKRILEQPGYSN